MVHLWYSSKMLLALLLLCALAVVSPAQSQEANQAPDTVRYFFNEVLITADRMQQTVGSSTASVSVVRGQEIRSLPITTFSSLFRSIPGFSIIEMDGTGRNPIINARGFYGGGEAEYNIVMVDGKKINDLETGLVNWSLASLNNVESIEIARGASSPLYGDAALGSVINILTHDRDHPGMRVTTYGGSLGNLTGSIQQRSFFGKHPFQVTASTDRTDGFRNHSKWSGTNFDGDLSLLLNERSTLTLSSENQWVNGDDPGPLTEAEVAPNRKGSSVFYHSDKKNEIRNQVHVDYSNSFSDRSLLFADVTYKRKDATVRRTFTNPTVILDQNFSIIGIDPTLFGDTKERAAVTNQFGISAEFSLTSDFGAVRHRLVAGVEENYGRLRSTYDSVQTGFAADYMNASPGASGLVADGKTRRWSQAFYLNNEFRLADPLTVSIGARYDDINDRSEAIPLTSAITSRHHAFSPKIGFNLQYVQDEKSAGHWYGTFNKSFKAPTLDQFSDQRPTDVAFLTPFGLVSQRIPPFSNSALKPQRGTSFETGVYQRLTWLPGSFGELMLSFYQIDMKDEIDFDFATYQYQNILESRHRGIETGLRLHWLNNLTTFFNYTMTSARFSAGANEGNYLKAIPRNIISLGAMYEHTSGLQASLMWDFVSNIPLDDENTTRLPDYNRGSVRLAYTISPIKLFVDVDNLLDKKFSTTGYILTGTTYLFPSAGRTIRGGVSLELH